MFPLFLPFSPLRSSFRLRPSLERSRRMASHSHFRPSFLLVPIKPSMRAASYFSGIEAWRRNTINYLDQQCAYLAATGHQGGIHLQALNTTLTECGSLVRDEIIVSTGGLVRCPHPQYTCYSILTRNVLAAHRRAAVGRGQQQRASRLCFPSPSTPINRMLSSFLLSQV